MKKHLIVLSGALLMLACNDAQKDAAASEIENQQELGASIPEKKEDLFAQIIKNNEFLANSTGADSLKFVANNQVALCENFIERFKTDQNGASVLGFGAKAARSAGRSQKAIQLYDQLIQLYPSDPNLAEYMFLKAFIYDEDLQDKEKAKDAYTVLMQRFPGSNYAKDAKLLIEQLYLSDEELIKQFEAKNKK